MIVSVDTVMTYPEFQGQVTSRVQARLDALETFVRKYTNNNFQNRNVRFYATTLNDRIMGVSPYITVGDTVQISESVVNNGLYVVTEVGSHYIRVNKSMYAVDVNLVTKIVYPEDVKQGVIRLLQWEIQSAGKVGVKSETISRHTVTYFDQDRNNQTMGYPVSLLGFLELYKKARF